ncbi:MULTISPECIES: hypothetical protein [Burkholderia]|uniref:Prevent-host-death protein n=2 Tax=Burkholderia cepacia complex TaxID=87882 RepID=A0A2S5DW91_9BURK|nr:MULTISPECIES: hypothetical protein [Burkholderia]EKS9795145.1 hypothetical protein [Burkholderia cepacia]EKS9807434.1 hypothetical protein [Burkholderia cepacia]EKS9814987.1 hypothetical protein [Burkholderia cepacia]EKS9822500.1 hypothetical protein [Burkholderia cepacia]EKS9828533.1 hypothetical protein [Burkholderia cepacia]
MQNANTPGTNAVDPAQRADATIRGDGTSTDRLVPGDPPVRFGVLQGQAWIADDFDAPLPDYLLDAFEGR